MPGLPAGIWDKPASLAPWEELGLRIPRGVGHPGPPGGRETPDL